MNSDSGGKTTLLQPSPPRKTNSVKIKKKKAILVSKQVKLQLKQAKKSNDNEESAEAYIASLVQEAMTKQMESMTMMKPPSTTNVLKLILKKTKNSLS